MKKFAIISVVLLAILCVFLSACDKNIMTIGVATEKYGDIQYISVTFEPTSSFAEIYKEQAEINQVVNYFNNARFDLRKDLTKEDLASSVTDYRVSIMFGTSSKDDSFSVVVCEDGKTYLTTKDALYMSKDKMDVNAMQTFFRTVK